MILFNDLLKSSWVITPKKHYFSATMVAALFPAPRESIKANSPKLEPACNEATFLLIVSHGVKLMRCLVNLASFNLHLSPVIRT